MPVVQEHQDASEIVCILHKRVYYKWKEFTHMTELGPSACLFYILDKDFSFYVQSRIELDEPVDHDQMQHALSMTISRYPYFKIKPVKNGERYCLEANDKPFLLYDDPESMTLAPDANNDYLLRVSAADRLLNVCFCHAITDGRGLLPFIKTLLYYYSLYHYGADPGMPDVRRAGEPVPEEESADPFAAFDTSSIKIPGRKADAPAVFRLPNEMDPERRVFAHTFWTDCDKFMEYSRSIDGSPNAMLSLYMCRALAQIYPEHIDDIVAGVACDLRKALGVKNSHQCTVSMIPIRYGKKLAGFSTDRAETAIRGRIIVGSDEDFIKPSLAQSKMFYTYINSRQTLQEKTAVSRAAVETGVCRATASVSYPNQQDYGTMNSHIRSFYIMCNSIKQSLGLEITSFGNRFFFAVQQGFDDDRYADELKRQMEAEGIVCKDYKKEILPNVPFMDL